MMRRVAFLSNVVALIATWFFASQVWASAVVTETKTQLTITALDAYPQLTVVLIAGLLMLFVARYLESSFARFMGSAISFFLFSAAAPVWFDSASGSLSVLGPQVTKLTGVSDWQAQESLIENGYYNHMASDLFIIGLIIWIVSIIVVLWSAKPGRKGVKFATRIDKLPSW